MKKWLLVMGCLACCGVVYGATVQEPAGVETTVEMEIDGIHEFRNLLLKHMFELDESGEKPEWRWVFSREQFDGLKKDYLEHLVKKRAAYKKVGKEWPAPKPSTFYLWWPDDTEVRACVYVSSWGA